jgi:tetratricopeptide (TPR) repeat protein
MARKGPLSVWKSITLHLARFSRYRDEFEVPFGVTQDGIAAGCGVSRAHAALELGKLVESAKAVERLAHVRGARTKKKVYFLADAAYAEATALRESTLAKSIAFKSAGGTVELGGQAALQRLTGALGLPEARALGIIMAGGEVDEERLATEKPSAASGPWAVPDHFVGRAAEARKLARWLAGDGKFAVVLGMPGIGKASLVAKALSGAGVPTLWHRGSRLDTADKFARELASFASLPGSAALGTRLPDAREIAAMLAADRKKRLVVLGDYSEASASLDSVMELLKNGSGGVRFVLCCVSKPSFYGVPETSGGDVVELNLGGLDEESAMELLEGRGIDSRKDALRLFRLTGGHPLALSLVKPGDEVIDRDAVRHLVRDVLGRLGAAELDALAGFSVHRRPVPQSAVGAGLPEVNSLLAAGLLLEDERGMMAAHGAVRAAVESSVPADAMKRHHSAAADFYLNAGDHPERLYHLAMAGRMPEAARHLKMHIVDILARGNLAEALAISMKCCAGRSDEMDDIVAGLALTVGDSRTALEISERLAKSGSRDIADRATVRSARLRLMRGDLDGARGILESSKGGCGAEGLRLLGSIQRKSGEYEKAAATLAKALAAARKAGDWRLAGEAANELGVVSLDLGDAAVAVSHLEEARKHAERAGERGDVAAILANMGMAAAQAGDVAGAAGKFGESMDVSRGAGLVRLEAAVATNLAHLHLSAGELAPARRVGERAVDLLEGIGDNQLVGAARINLGLALAKLKKPGAAAALEAGVADVGNLPGPGMRGRRLADAAAGFAELGDRRRAAELAGQAAALLREAGDEEGAAGAEKLAGSGTARVRRAPVRKK